MSTELNTAPYPIKQLSLTKLLLLHLIPGALITVSYSLIVNFVTASGYTKVFALGITSILVLVPTQLGYILYSSKKNYGVFSISKTIPYREKIKLKDYLIFVPLLFLWTVLIFAITISLNAILLDKVFYWLPDWYVLNENLGLFSREALIATFLSCLLFTGLIAPIVEELYFRGFLLPRMSWMGRYAPLVSAVLFGVYHFWSPWVIITRILAIIPMTYVVHQKKNIYIGMIVHCMLNILGDAVAVLMLIL